MTETIDLLKIIAGETGRLTPQDREAIKRAADELEASEKLAQFANASLVESRAQVIALNDRIIQLTAELQQHCPAPVAKAWSMGTGWLEVGPNNA